MKSLVVVALISLACFFAIFHSCHGIVCYFCVSKNYGNESCETISSNEFIYDYGEKVENCMKLILFKNDTGNATRLLFRIGFADKALPDVENMVKVHRDGNYTVNLFTCKENRCNGK